MRSVSTISAALVCLCSAAAAAGNIDCSGLMTYQGCEPMDAGARPAEEYAARGYDLLRVAGFHALDGHDVDFEIVRMPYGVRWLRIRDPRDVGEGVIVHIDEAAADAFFAAWREFQGDVKRQNIPARKIEMDRNPPCADGGIVQVDEALDGKARHVLMDECLVERSYEFAHRLAERAIALVPLCKDMPAYPSPVCLCLEGDKLAALAVVRLMEQLRTTERPDWSDLVVGTPDITVEGRRVGGVSWLAEHANMLHGYEVLTAEGLDGAVRVNGRIWSFPDDQPPGSACARAFCAASSVQMWKRGTDGRFRLESWSIGKPAPTNLMF